MRLTLIFLSVVLVTGCSFRDAQSVKEIDAGLKELDEIIANLEAEVEDYSLDYNFDGIADVTFKSYESTYVQFIDRNFDGNPDERYEYHKGTDFVLDGRLDENFDGVFETQVVMSQGVIKYEFVDSNNDRVIDIVKEYENGVLRSLDLFIPSYGSNDARIKTFLFNFGVPYESDIKNTKMSVHDFHIEQTKKITPQKMYKDAAGT